MAVGLPGSVVAGPRVVAGLVVVHTGLISEAVGAAGLPAICGVGAVAWAEPLKLTPTVTEATRVTAPITPSRTIALALGMAPARSMPSDRPGHGVLE